MRSRALAFALSIIWLAGFAGLLGWWFTSGHYFIEILWFPWSLIGGFAVAFATARNRRPSLLVGAALVIAAAASLSLLYRYEQSVATRLAREVAALLQSPEPSGASFELDCPVRDPVLTAPTQVELRDFTFGAWIFVFKSPSASIGFEVARGQSGQWRGSCYELPAA